MPVDNDEFFIVYSVLGPNTDSSNGERAMVTMQTENEVCFTSVDFGTYLITKKRE